MTKPQSTQIPQPPNEDVTAAVLVIGDEILSGRTKEANAGYIADVLTAAGIRLREVRVVADDQTDIVDALNAMTTSPPTASPRRSGSQSTSMNGRWRG